MLDSPAQTPTPKSHHPPPSSSGTLPADAAMVIDDNNNNTTTGAPAAAANRSSWDTKKYREELNVARSRLQHQNFDIGRILSFHTHSLPLLGVVTLRNGA